MNNTIEAHIEFSYQGETYTLSSIIDLDPFMEHELSLPSFHAILARDHKIDTYSYLFEVMQETEIEFRNARGIAAQFLNDKTFDFDGFTADWREHKVITLLQPIATRELGVANLSQDQRLKNALIQAYNLGKST